VTGPATTNAILEVIAHDAAGNRGSDVTDGPFTITSGTTDVFSAAVTDFALPGVWPHPVRGAAHVRFALPRAASIRLSVHDVQGRTLAVLAEGEWGSGIHEVTWNGTHAPAGLYFLRLSVPGRTLTRRMVRVE